MLIKNRSSLVITISSVIITLALALTIFGFYAYLEWKEKKLRRNYRLAVYDSDAELFEKYIMVYLRAKVEAGNAPGGQPLIEGTIKNTSNKKVYSIKMKIAFCDPEGRVVYVDTIYPIGLGFESFVNIGDITQKTRSFIPEGGAMSFTYLLKNCPPEVREYLGSKLKFAKSEESRALELVHKIEGLNIR